MLKIIALANQKGGVGKTTTAVNLAASLALAEVPVLLIDLDSQANASSGLGVTNTDPARSTYPVLTRQLPLDDAIIQHPVESLPLLDLAPACADLVGAEIELIGESDRALRLKEALAESRTLGRYRFVLIDCPPSLGLLTLNALCAAQTVLAPVQAEYYALEGVSRLWKTLELVRKELNPSLAVEGIVPTMVDTRTNLARQAEQELRTYFSELVYDVSIPRNIRLAEAPSHGIPAVVYDTTSPGGMAYLELAAALCRRNGVAI